MPTTFVRISLELYEFWIVQGLQEWAPGIKIQLLWDEWMKEGMNMFVFTKDLVTREATAAAITQETDIHKAPCVLAIAGYIQDASGISPSPKSMIATLFKRQKGLSLCYELFD